MSTSQNGWPAGDRKAANVGTFLVPGTSVALAMNRDAAPLLLWAARQYHRTVEPLHAGWCWGYADRPIRGATQLSNHASGTAIDLNAPRHPLGIRGTYSGSERAALQAIVAHSGGLLRAGEFYNGRVDGMHLEVVGSHAAVIAHGKVLLMAKASTGATDGGPTGAFPLCSRFVFGPDPRDRMSWYDGSESPAAAAAVRAVQREVGSKADGHYGADTLARVKRWQASVHLPATGVVDAATWAVMTRR